MGKRDEHRRRREFVEEMARFAVTPVRTCGLCVFTIGFCAYICELRSDAFLSRRSFTQPERMRILTRFGIRIV